MKDTDISAELIEKHFSLHIGFNKSISKEDYLKQNFEFTNKYIKVQVWNRVRVAIRIARKKGKVYVICKRNKYGTWKYFVPMNLNEIKDYNLLLNNNIEGSKINSRKVKKYVTEQRWKLINN